LLNEASKLKEKSPSASVLSVMGFIQYIKRPAVLKVITKTEKREKKIKF